MQGRSGFPLGTCLGILTVYTHAAADNEPLTTRRGSSAVETEKYGRLQGFQLARLISLLRLTSSRATPSSSG